MLPNDLDDLERIVAEKLEESVRLEFKRQLPESGKNDDLARDLATLANTEGGVIIYGIEEDDGKAKALAPFDVKGATERVALVAQSLDEPLTLASVFAIAAKGDTGMGFFVVEVPRSERAPHFYKGAALGRFGRATVPLTRRQVGELFARSPGFAEEFGLKLGRPGRVLARIIKEAYQESRGGRPGSPELRTRYRYYIGLENDGDSDVFDADWSWVQVNSGDQLPNSTSNPCPLKVMHPGAQASIGLSVSIAVAQDLELRTVWRDANELEHSATWPVSW